MRESGWVSNPGSFACRLGSHIGPSWRPCVQRERNAIPRSCDTPLVCSEAKLFGEYRNEILICHRRGWRTHGQRGGHRRRQTANESEATLAWYEGWSHVGYTRRCLPRFHGRFAPRGGPIERTHLSSTNTSSITLIACLSLCARLGATCVPGADGAHL